jgi:hypothetical protein
MSAQEYPEDFDGILSGAPAINLPDLTVSTYWPQSVMDRMGVYPSKCEMDGILAASVRHCDGIDGIQDSSIADPDACDFDPQAVVGQVVACSGNQTVRISSQAAAIVRAIRDGPRGADGTRLFVGTPHGTPFTGVVAGGNTDCAANGNTTDCKGRPFPMSIDWIKLLTRRDPSYNVTNMTLAELERNYAITRQHLNPIIAGNDPDLSQFKELNKKMISWHGMADECITMRSTRSYYNRVLALDREAGNYYRHFEAPGVNHCSATLGAFYPLRALNELILWVEAGIAPDVLVGHKMALASNADDPPETRPVCMYPDVLKYDGGNLTDYTSFSCGPKGAESARLAKGRDALYGVS